MKQRRTSTSKLTLTASDVIHVYRRCYREMAPHGSANVDVVASRQIFIADVCVCDVMTF